MNIFYINEQVYYARTSAKILANEGHLVTLGIEYDAIKNQLSTKKYDLIVMSTADAPLGKSDEGDMEQGGYDVYDNLITGSINEKTPLLILRPALVRGRTWNRPGYQIPFSSFPLDVDLEKIIAEEK